MRRPTFLFVGPVSIDLADSVEEVPVVMVPYKEQIHHKFCSIRTNDILPGKQSPVMMDFVSGHSPNNEQRDVSLAHE